MEGKWSFNTPNNDFWGHGTYDTKEEAEKEAKGYAKHMGCKEMVIGEVEFIPLPTYVDVDDTLEKLNDQYAEEAGLEYDGNLYDKINKDGWRWLEKEMEKVIERFHEEFNVESTWFKVVGVYTIEIGGTK